MHSETSHWEVEVLPRRPDTHRWSQLLEEAGCSGPRLTRTSRIYLLSFDRPMGTSVAERIAGDLLTDHTVEQSRVARAGQGEPGGNAFATVLLKPGVMDPAAESIRRAVADLELPVPAVQTGRRFYFERPPNGDWEPIARTLANDAIERVVLGPLPESVWQAAARPYRLELIVVPIRNLPIDALLQLGRDRQLHLSREEWQTVQGYFRTLDRDPTDAELETIAQTWSEHCSHKTLKGRVEFHGPDGVVRYDNLLKDTIFRATAEIRKRLGPDDWCVSVFEDNAGIVRFDDGHHVCFKVETHNHPSAIEPYGGASTGLGGVIRDVLGCGLGGKPICNTDVFAFAPPDYPVSSLPSGVLHPKRIMRGVVAGVRDYGNRMGIPTVNGAVVFDDRYLGNPLVYCGTVGLIPAGKESKRPRPGDRIVVVGGRTGRDGIHGATFSSVGLTHESEQQSGTAVQIGNAITEKKLLDVLLQARDRELYHAITDCGAGGFSSAIGEMAAPLGATVHLDRAPLKYQGLSYTEIWISEAQERMILAVPPDRWPVLNDLCLAEDVEATVLGTFEETGRLRLYYQNHLVADLDLGFLHEGRPKVVRKAVWPPTGKESAGATAKPLPSDSTGVDYTEVLRRLLGSLNICSKEWVIRQYDHEVQGGSVIKPLVGSRNDGPGDAAVLTPVAGSLRGIAVGCGINPRYGDADPYRMAASAIDEAVRNVVAVGADPERIALLDNFSWGNPELPDVLGSLVRAVEACRDVALALGTPFISGKDSLYNEFTASGRHLAIPPTLLISALGQVPDVRRCVTMDLKKPGDLLFLLGRTRNEMGGSHYHLVRGLSGGEVPDVDLKLAPELFRRLHQAMRNGWIVACHDLSEGGLAVAAAEMAFAGEVGTTIDLQPALTTTDACLSPEAALFSESNSRFLIEVEPENGPDLVALFAGLPCVQIGVTVEEPWFEVSHAGRTLIRERLDSLKSAWQEPLQW